LFLTRVRLGLFERDLAHRFSVSVNKIKQHLPDSFKGRYENVRGILDCTELKRELPKDYQKHSEMY
ncbi:unnamed protein product, partial [Porites evermanni]